MTTGFKYENIRNNTSFPFYKGYTNVIDHRRVSLFFYLVDKMFCKPCYQTVLKKKFDVNSMEWKNIYKCKLLDFL